VEVILDLEYRTQPKRRHYSFRGLKFRGERPIKITSFGIRRDSKEYFLLRNSIDPQYINNIHLN